MKKQTHLQCILDDLRMTTLIFLSLLKNVPFNLIIPYFINTAMLQKVGWEPFNICVFTMGRHSHTQTYLPTNTCLSVVAWDLSDFLQDNPFKPTLNSWLFSMLSSNMLYFAGVNCSAADCVSWDYFHLARSEGLCLVLSLVWDVALKQAVIDDCCRSAVTQMELEASLDFRCECDLSVLLIRASMNGLRRWLDSMVLFYNSLIVYSRDPASFL